MSEYGAEIVNKPTSFSTVPTDKAIVCVVNNSIFEAAAFCYDADEFEAFGRSDDYRPKTWLIMDRQMAKDLTGCKY